MRKWINSKNTVLAAVLAAATILSCLGASAVSAEDMDSDFAMEFETVETESEEEFLLTEGTPQEQEAIRSGTGWISYGSDFYYAVDGALVKNQLRDIGNYTYYFDSEGRMIEDCETLQPLAGGGSRTIRLDENGHLVRGWYSENSGGAAGVNWYYYGTDGARAEGITLIDGAYYYFEPYMKKDYEYRGTESWYSFGSDGRLEDSLSLRGTGWREYRGNWYYVNAGILITNQMYRVQNQTYFFDANGIMKTDFVYERFHPEKERRVYYRFDQKGHMVTGWYAEQSSSQGKVWYYYDSDGSSASGLIEVDGKTYYLDRQGKMYKNQYVTVDNTLYYLGSDGSAADSEKLTGTRWFTFLDHWSYVRNGELLVNGLYQIGKDTYSFDEQGKMAANQEITVDHTRYYFSASGRMTDRMDLTASGWHLYRNNWYYVSSPSTGILRSTFSKIGNYTYYFDENGIMYADRSAVIASKNYRFDAKGHMICGWYQDPADRSWYLYNQSGHMVIGWYQDPNTGTWYYLDESGRMFTGVLNGRYYFKSNGAMLIGWYQDPETKDWYYFTENGMIRDNWYHDETRNLWYYFDIKGVMYADRVWVTQQIMMQPGFHDSRYFLTYRFDKNGAMITGWYQDPETKSWYYYLKNGAMYVGWLKDANTGKRYYFRTDGIMLANTAMRNYDERTYRLAADGHVIYGWYQDPETKVWYCSQPDGRVCRGWYKDPNTEIWYYFENDGQMVTGTKIINGITYTFAESGRLIIGTKVVNGVTYTYAEDGRRIG